MGADVKRKADKIIAASRALSPRYDRAIREGGLQDLLLVRHELMAAVRRADRILAEAITDDIERRLANDS